MSKAVIPINRCLHPVRVYTSDGLSFYPCGKCAACRKSYHSLWRTRLIHEMQRPDTTTLFCTLTYSNEHLPLVTVDPDTSEILSITRTKFLSGTSYKYYRTYATDYFTKRFGSDFRYLDSFASSGIPHFVQSRKGKTLVYDSSDSFAICLRADVQDFIKRLRSSLSRNPLFVDKDISFTYFICSEYGPKTFRPHYHGLLFFRDPSVAQSCNDKLIFECWKKCDASCLSSNEPISKLVNNKHGAASYVSKYVTCDTPLPSLLNTPLFRPFHLQSNSCPIGSHAFPLSDIPYKIAKGDLLSHYSFFDKKTLDFVSIDMPFPSSLWNRVFPRFLFERNLSDFTLLRIFQRIYSYRGHELPNLTEQLNAKYGIGQPFHSTTPVSTIVDPLKPYNYYLRSCAGYSAPDSFNPYTLHQTLTLDTSVVTYSSIFSRLINDVNFLDLYLFGIPQNLTCCRKILRCFETLDFCSSVHSYFSLFKQFRSQCESLRLKSQYEYSNAVIPLNSHYTPALVSELYPTFYSSLCPTLSDYTDLSFFDYDFTLSSRFDLSLMDFYDSDGNLIPPSAQRPEIYSEYRSTLSNYFTKKRSNAIFNADKFNDY